MVRGFERHMVGQSGLMSTVIMLQKVEETLQLFSSANSSEAIFLLLFVPG